MRRMAFALVAPTDTPQSCETMNGNVVLIPRSVYSVVGNIDERLHPRHGRRRLRAPGSICWVPGIPRSRPRRHLQREPSRRHLARRDTEPPRTPSPSGLAERAPGRRMGGAVPSPRRAALARSGALALRPPDGGTTTMRIAITGQISLRQLADLLDQPAAVPAGRGGTPPLPEVRALIARGHDVSLVTLDPDLTSEVVLRGDRLTVHVGPFRQRHAARDGFRMERQFVAQTLLRCRPDVVHAHWTYECALGALATGLPTVVTAHDAPLVALRHNLPTTRMGPLFAQVPTAAHFSVCAAMAALVARKATRLIAVSPYVERHFRRVLRYRGEITVIPNMMPSMSRRPVSTHRPAAERGHQVLHDSQFVERAQERDRCDRSLR
jgi:hypothetical protein